MSGPLTRALVMRQRGSAAFTPAALASIYTWLRADLGVTLVSSKVSVWADQGGLGHDYAQGTAGQRPTVGTLAGQSAIRFDAVGNAALQVLKGPIVSASAAHVFLVMKIDAEPPVTYQGGLWRFGAAGANNHIPYTDGNVYDGFGSTVRKGTGNPTLNLSTTVRLYEVITTSSEWTSKIDGGAHYTTATNTVGWDAVGSYLGADNYYGAVAMTGHVAEMVLCSAKLTTERATLIAYLNARYGTAWT